MTRAVRQVDHSRTPAGATTTDWLACHRPTSLGSDRSRPSLFLQHILCPSMFGVTIVTIAYRLNVGTLKLANLDPLPSAKRPEISTDELTRTGSRGYPACFWQAHSIHFTGLLTYFSPSRGSRIKSCTELGKPFHQELLRETNTWNPTCIGHG